MKQSNGSAGPCWVERGPLITLGYNELTGALETQSETFAGGEEKTVAIVQKDNTIDQTVEYQDGTGNIAKYRYEDGGDARLLEASEGDGDEAASKQSYSYDETTGLMTRLVDSAPGTFTAGYDLEGNMTSEIYPNGMCENTTYDSAGVATALSYVKTRNCAEEDPTAWFKDAITPGIHGETLAQESTLADETYAYDPAGRLLETTEEPAGKGCTTRVYAYDQESNRLSLTTRAPAAEGKCATEGGTIEDHAYDEADRLIDEGVDYEALGNITALPANDAEGKADGRSGHMDEQGSRRMVAQHSWDRREPASNRGIRQGDHVAAC